ncbi:hypothetical protein [Nocardia brasiliensis]|uniref:hypothetical protein n=1 Tax=Nocardia brasiliensis TaxID=37326 RepID=UPI00245782E4|nr:hypothetical protein [Nocardia brasiliensis]
MLRAAYWNAARFGLDGNGLDPVSRRVVPAPARLSALLEHVAPALDELGDRTFVTDAVATVLERGNGARRQIAAFRNNGRVSDVVTELADATLEKCR